MKDKTQRMSATSFLLVTTLCGLTLVLEATGTWTRLGRCGWVPPGTPCTRFFPGNLGKRTQTQNDVVPDGGMNDYLGKQTVAQRRVHQDKDRNSFMFQRESSHNEDGNAMVYVSLRTLAQLLKDAMNNRKDSPDDVEDLSQQMDQLYDR